MRVCPNCGEENTSPSGSGFCSLDCAEDYEQWVTT